LLALGGCAEPPSYELEWRIAGNDATDEMLADAPALIAVNQCAEVGLFWVYVVTKHGEDKVSEDQFPCFSTAEGPPLEPGEYTLEIKGLRRNGEEWVFDADAGTPRVAYAEVPVTVVEGEVPSVQAFLRAPPGCDDGIDNDRDGTVDNQDPGCEVATPEGFSESNDADLTLFQLAVTFLESPVVRPSNVGVTGIRLEVVDQFEKTITSHQLDLTQSPFRMPLLTAEFAGNGMLELLATAFGPEGDLTETESLMFSVMEGEGSYVVGTFDFGTAQFLDPIVEPIVLAFDPGCEPGGVLALDSMRIRVLDEMGVAKNKDALGLTGSAFVGGSTISITAVDQPGGWISFECPSSLVSSIPLTWGHYSIETEAQLAGTTCYASPPVDLAPQPINAQNLVLERVMIDDGMPDTPDMPACPECTVDTDCLGQICTAGLCVDKEPG
jgi:hypothetical protein